jgi:hypothetical protein
MSTSEIESEKAGFKSRKRINGWWRLWIVSSMIWTISVVIYSTTAWFNDLSFPRIELEHITYTMVLIITPSIIIAALGKSIEWIVKGFKP